MQVGDRVRVWVPAVGWRYGVVEVVYASMVVVRWSDGSDWYPTRLIEVVTA